ncbi:hypothetical protein [Candidatus Marimicrobium litorale]|uniref:SnoaL-like domain-containing protein n=1 Tax=Candidatus Marimicrobium litorale TaxID=2518991 RepID=A0ABT3T364_9GAMM|nr:hypothetical protein [Candidatus Marimicrobium litorale]MCX2976705.1 hypothetical protein [Candidatus Marimicrobium litorale]
MSSGASPMFTTGECIAFAERSPRAVANKDRRGWIDLFAQNSVVEDPVGSAPHISGVPQDRGGARTASRLGAFYDTFIAPNEIQFHVDRDNVSGLQIMRDLTIQIDMSTQVTVYVPVHLLYELCIQEGELKIARLAAHWELLPMLKQQMASGWPFLRVGLASALRLLRHLGWGGMLGFARALFGVGEAGKQQAIRFAEYFNAHKQAELTALFELHALPSVDAPGFGGRRPLQDMLKEDGVVVLSKVLAAGDVVSATVHYQQGERDYRGVALFKLQRRSLQIDGVSFYWSA